MQDRISNHPNRWVLTPVTGETDTYDFTRADDPTQVGTPLNKATFLPDAVASAIESATGVSDVELPADALDAIATFISGFGDISKSVYVETGSYVGTGIISSLSSQSGNNVYIKNIASAPSLTFSFKPRFLFIKRHTASSIKYYSSGTSQRLFDPTISASDNNTGTNGLVWVYPFTNIGSRGFILNGNTIKWFYASSTSDAADLLNTSSTTYYYLAMGVE
jgi:hypothetical protein